MENKSVESENILKKIANFICKDVKAQNETKKLIVVIRLLVLSIIVYFTINGAFIISKLNTSIIFFYSSFFIIFLGVFVMSYHFRSNMTLWIFNIGMIFWIWIDVHLFGWNIGVQHFLMVLLILYFFSSYKQYLKKILYAVFLCALRILLFYIYHYKQPMCPLELSDENILQIINTIVIFWCISVISFFFSNDSQELESKLVEYNIQLEKQANTDALTGLYNRRKALEYLDSLINLRTEFSLCICDIDFFKKVNDTYGHDIGDEVLKGIANIFMEETKGQNFVARWGGEEFIILFPGCNGDDSFHKLSQIRKKINKMKIKKGDLEISVTVTFGLAEYDFHNDLTATIKEADKKLYLGKEQGRDRIVF